MRALRALGTGMLIGAVFAQLGYGHVLAFLGLGLMFIALIGE